MLEAKLELLHLAAEGCVNAEYWIGDLEEFRFNDLSKAAQWYQRAANHGHAKSQWCIANLYMTGKGVKLSQAEAIKYYQAAAENQIPEAQFTLGELYRSGSAGMKNINTSLYWYQQSARLGYEPAKKRIQQHWPNGEYIDSRQNNISAPDTNNVDHIDDPILSQLLNTIIGVALLGDYIPNENIPFVSELKQQQLELLASINAYYDKADDNNKLTFDNVENLFVFVFRRGCDALYQWHSSPTKAVDSGISYNNPLRSEQYIHTPHDIQQMFNEIEAPQFIYDAFASWFNDNREYCQMNSIDKWVPLTMALMPTYAIGASVALKILGYRK